MPSLAEVKAQIKALPHKYIFYTKREIKYLPRILTDDEQILALTSGYHGKTTVLLVCTNRRLLFVDKGMFFGLKVKQLNLDRIQSIDSSYVIVFGNIQVWDGAAAYRISLVLKESIDPFVRSVRDAIQQYRAIAFRDATATHIQSRQAPAPQPKPQPAQYHPPQQAVQVDMLEQLERLAKLREAGHLSDEEFALQKKKLLAEG
jgi:hypothetical protein